MSFSSVFGKRDSFQRGINTEGKRSCKGGNDLVHFSNLSQIWLMSRKQEKKIFSDRKKLNFKGNFYL